MGFDLFSSLNKSITAPYIAEMEHAALKKARETQQQQYGVNKGYYQPYYDTGTSALHSLASNVNGGAYNVNLTPQNLGEDPGYQFQLAQGQKALERSAAAHGGLNSGGFAKALDNYSQGLASTQYQSAWNRQFQQNQFNYNSLANLAGVGERAAGNLGGLGERYGSTMAGYDIAHGNINAAEALAQTGGAAGFADGATDIGVAVASGYTGNAGGMKAAMGGSGGGMGDPTSNAANPGAFDGGYGGGYGGDYGGGQSIGAIPAQSAGYSGYGQYGGNYSLGNYGGQLIPPQMGGRYY